MIAGWHKSCQGLYTAGLAILYVAMLIACLLSCSITSDDNLWPALVINSMVSLACEYTLLLPPPTAQPSAITTGNVVISHYHNFTIYTIPYSILVVIIYLLINA